MPKSPSTGGQSAPQNTPVETVMVAPRPVYRRKSIERQGGATSAMTQRYPVVRGGVCDFCGIIDRNYQYESSGVHQYELCPHFRDIGKIACSYCPSSKDPGEVISRSKMLIAGHPDNPDKLVVWCDSYTCSKAHEERFKVSQ